METLGIGQVAKRADVGVETVRFYEREGLIEPPPRRRSGYRQYPGSVVDRIQFIKAAKGLGFTLREIRELLALKLDSDASCGQVKQQAEAKLADIEGRIRSLRRMKRALQKLTDACAGKGAVDDCPILAALEKRSRS